MKKPNLTPIIVSLIVLAGFFLPGEIHQARWRSFKKHFAASLPSGKAEIISEYHKTVSRHINRLTRAQAIDILGEPSSSSDTILSYEWLYPDGDACRIELTFGPDGTVKVQKPQWRS